MWVVCVHIGKSFENECNLKKKKKIVIYFQTKTVKEKKTIYSVTLVMYRVENCRGLIIYRYIEESTAMTSCAIE